MLDVAEKVGTQAPRERRELNRYHDRCDRCQSEAFMIASKEDSELLFCGHHGKKYSVALLAGGWYIDDYTDEINESPSVSANVAYEESE